ncbi:uncharacterized protein [Diadema antillarum]|uniref:uncharacterized protein n=1 Tax=Diadema antillarum TaxID=105358 RepID=UPI003A880565
MGKQDQHSIPGPGDENDLDALFDQVAGKLGWSTSGQQSIDALFERLSHSTKKKKKARKASRKQHDVQPSEEVRSLLEANKESCSNSSGKPSKQSSRADPTLKLTDSKRAHHTDRLNVSPCIADHTTRHCTNKFWVCEQVSKSKLETRHCDFPEQEKVGKDSRKQDLDCVESELHSCLDLSSVVSIDTIKSSIDPLPAANGTTVDCTTTKLTERCAVDSNAGENFDSAVTEGRANVHSFQLCNDCSNIKDAETSERNNSFTEPQKVTPRSSDRQSPELLQWLMSPPRCRGTRSTDKIVGKPISYDGDCGQQAEGQEDNSDSSDDKVEDLLPTHVLSLTERLAEKHRSRKIKLSSSHKSRRRRSCANPKSAAVFLNEDSDDGRKDDDKGNQTKGERAKGERGADDEDEKEEEELEKGGTMKFDEDSDPEKSSKEADSRLLKEISVTRNMDSSSDDDFESFLNAIKTPQQPASDQVASDEEVFVIADDSDFIDDTPLTSNSDDEDDDVFYLKINNRDNPLTHHLNSQQEKTPISPFPVSDDDDDFTPPRWTPAPQQKRPKATTSTGLSTSIPSQKTSAKITSAKTTSAKTTSTKPRRPLQVKTNSSSNLPPSFATPSRTSGTATPSFLASLSTPSKGMPTRSRYVSDFKRNRDELTQRLFKLYNKTIFDDKLPADFSITWNTRMRKTAGFCFYKKRLGNERTARIELSIKVCDSAERLRDTLIHELCHAAAWLIHGVSDGHGRFWKYWAAKANLAHPEIPIIKRCHTYEIHTKYKYKCVQCGNIIGRHSKSVDTSRFCCAYCSGRLELQPTLNKDGTPAKARGPNPFAMFVKQNYASVKKTHSATNHADVMRLLSQEFADKAKIAKS